VELYLHSQNAHKNSFDLYHTQATFHSVKYKFLFLFFTDVVVVKGMTVMTSVDRCQCFGGTFSSHLQGGRMCV
jgi:hypothetical protein